MINIGDIVKVDGIECTVFYIDEEKVWAIDNHGAGYYFNEKEDNSSSALLFEWGARSTNINSLGEYLGDGFQNSETALANEDCYVAVGSNNMTIWSALKTLREQRNSNRWFIGSKDENYYAFNGNNPNIDTSTRYYTSTQDTNLAYAYATSGNTGGNTSLVKSSRLHLRLLCTFTEDEISAKVEITQEDGGDIRYTKNGSDPDESSSLYESPISAIDGDTIKARGYFNNFTLPSDIASITIDTTILPKTDSIPLGTELEDGFIYYDRGEEYGNYNLSDGKLTRLSSGVDDGSPDSKNWRFIIHAKQDMPGNDKEDGNKIWGPDKLTLINDDDGLFNTMRLIQLYGNNSDYLWFQVKKTIQETGKKWFVASSSEWVFNGKYGDISDKDETDYFTSTEYNSSNWLAVRSTSAGGYALENN